MENIFKKFDELFNIFMDQTNNDEINKFKEAINKINYFKSVSNEDLDNEIKAQLGDPNRIEEYTENGFNYKKLIWDSAGGEFIKIIITKNDSNSPVEVITTETLLKQQLDDAVACEDYLVAADLRDKINALHQAVPVTPEKKTRKKRLK